YGVERMRDPVDVIGHLAFPDAHNIILNTMAESGVVGLAGLLATLALYAAAIRRSWRRSLGDRLVIAGALFGLAVFAAHGMVDVIFGLVGIIVIAVAVAAIAATSSEKAEAASHPAPWPMRAGLAFAFMIVILISGAVIRTETIAGTVAVADAALGSAPAEALVLARLATASAPDLVPAWWVQMAAADAVGDTEAAVEAARTLIKLEGFGQQWMSLAILASRQGDRTAADTAIKTASGRLPIDPLVELNGIAMLDALSDRPVTEEMGYRLLQVQPDIEPIVRDGSARMEATLAAVRARAARQLLAEGDDQSAFLVALSGEDHALSQVLLDEVATNGSTQGETWSQIVRGWFGDSTGREALDRLSRLDPKLDNLLWSWRFAGRACDEQAMAFWERAVEIGYAFHPTTPNSLTIAPPTSRANLPLLYPTFIWRQDHPVQPYVAGTWIFDSGRPVCVRSGG
ncbi:MAG TPA: hypothetical protein VM285_02755, partial [Polyangia bacterium]|nr:hypothetical protein [Polyangia bacterium]